MFNDKEMNQWHLSVSMDKHGVYYWVTLNVNVNWKFQHVSLLFEARMCFKIFGFIIKHHTTQVTATKSKCPVVISLGKKGEVHICIIQ